MSLFGGEEAAPQPLASAMTQTPTAPKIQPAALTRRETVLNASGYITARRMATVSAEVMGLIAEVDVEEGMSVGEGQVLARLDDAKAKVNLDFALAQVRVLQARQASIIANLEEARRQRVRYAGLSDKHYSSRAQLTQSEAAVESLQAELASARADIEVAKLEVQRQRERLEDHTIRAPFSGVVTQKNAQPGEIVAPSSAGGGFTRTGICTIVDMDSLEIEVDVNEAFIGRVSPGQKVNANLDAYPDWDIPATVVAIIPTADRAKATVRVRIGIDARDARILPDMGVKVGFMATEHSGAGEVSPQQ
ncbi:efflux RND transporter periplasmic adaptor subunit [Microbulbifer taiwanensis]|uniref:efflux RND transporter periplasmic adaptor subunit n=1 Tax=Microbulbifer taiwanensis TaxID=986746 RepID=UPI00360E2CB3